MSTYLAWDGKEYPDPPPAGWYLAADGRWWPEGYGPGPSTSGATPATSDPVGDKGPDGFGPDPLIEAAPAPVADGPFVTAASDPFGAAADVGGPSGQSGTPSGSGGSERAALGVIVAVVSVVALAAVTAFVVLRADDEEASPATTVVRTASSDVQPADPDDDASTPATTATTRPSGPGSADDPFAYGTEFTIAYTVDDGERVWNIQVLEPLTDITAAVIEENQFNDEPPEGSRFVGARLRATFVDGPEPGTPFDLDFSAVGDGGVVRRTFEPSCGVIPDALDSFAELTPGGAVEGWVCWVASGADVDDMTLIVRSFFGDKELHTELTP